MCVKDDNVKGFQVCIVTGPRVEISITLIDRLKAIFYNKLGILFQNKRTVFELNGVNIEVYPSHHLDALRGLANVSFILLDEADFFPPGQQQDARDNLNVILVNQTLSLCWYQLQTLPTPYFTE